MAIWMMAAWLLIGVPVGDPVNKIVAVVEGTPITLWEVEVEARLRGLEQRGLIPEGRIENDQLAESLEQLINRMLVLQAAERFQVPSAAEEEVAEQLAVLRERAVYPLDEQLDDAGIDESKVVSRIQARLRLQALIQRRLRDLVYVSDDEVQEYLEENPAPMENAEELIREYLATIRLQERIDAFFEGLRERAQVRILASELAPVRRSAPGRRDQGVIERVP